MYEWGGNQFIQSENFLTNPVANTEVNTPNTTSPTMTGSQLLPTELTQAYGQNAGYLQGLANTLTPEAVDQLSKMLSGYYMDPTQNQAFQNLTQAATGVAQDFYNQQSSQATANAAGLGARTGGSASTNIQSDIASQLANQLGLNTAQAGMNIYNQGFGAMANAVSPAMGFPQMGLSNLLGMNEQMNASLNGPMQQYAQFASAWSPNTQVANSYQYPATDGLGLSQGLAAAVPWMNWGLGGNTYSNPAFDSGSLGQNPTPGGVYYGDR